MISESTIVAAVPRNVSVDLDNESVILDTASGVYFGLDAVGQRIWELIAAPCPVRAVHAALVDDYAVEHDRCLVDLLRFLEEMHAEGLIETHGSVEG